MKDKINVAELLKDCPQGMELDCTMFDNLYFNYIDGNKVYPICCYTEDHLKAKHPITFTWLGRPSTYETAKCAIFPKGKTTWEGFQRPFKDGDVLFVKSAYSWILIYKESEDKRSLYKYAAISNHPNHKYIHDGNCPICLKEDISETRFATEEEKKKLFDAIKSNGYKWNAEKKELEKLIEPKFKVGDRIQDKDSYEVTIIEVNIEDECYGYESVILKGIGGIGFNEQDDWELVPNKFDISTLKPFDRVLVRNGNGQVWTANFFSHIIDTNPKLPITFVCVGGSCPNQYIPFKGNEYLRGKTSDCNEYYKTWEE